MKFTLEQCKNISNLLKRKNIKLEDKKEIAQLLLNALNKINCKNCNYSGEVPSWAYGFEIKCDILKYSLPECLLIKNSMRMESCPYIKYEDEATRIINEYQKSRK